MTSRSFLAAAGAELRPLGICSFCGTQGDNINKLCGACSEGTVLEQSAQVLEFPQAIANRAITHCECGYPLERCTEAQEKDCCRRFDAAGNLRPKKSIPKVFISEQLE